MVDFKIGDLVNGTPAKASSESMYTKTLAREGVFGVLKTAVFLFFVFHSTLKNNLPSFLVATTILVLNASISILSNIYSIFGFIYIWLYFSIITQGSFKLRWYRR